jgi:alkylation response protein AidB-like acyl-CoA dehydrogenase
MDLNPSAEQQQLIDAFVAFYAKESSIERVRAAEPTGHDAALWSQLQDMGALLMAVDEASGGWGASLLDLALVAEQHGRYLGSAPLIEGQTAVRLLARTGSLGAGLLGPSLHEGRLVTVALHPPQDGILAMVPAGAVADDVIYLDQGRLMAMVIGGRSRTVANIGSMPVADITIDATAVELLTGELAGSLFETARDEWLVLMANALVGVGARSIEIGVAYARERHAFGVPIGSFQAVSHGLADAATAMEGGTLLAREAAWAADEDTGRAAQLANFAGGFCTEAAREASYRSLHYHGGYGFMLEFDIQLFFRRAKAWPAVFAEPSQMFARGEIDRLAATPAGG